MGKFVAGDVVVTLFPFSGLSTNRRRPALVLAEAEFGDFILCQITSKPYSSQIAIPLDTESFARGGLPINSYVRPDKLFIAEASLFEKSAGTLRQKQLEVVLANVCQLFS